MVWGLSCGSIQLWLDRRLSFVNSWFPSGERSQMYAGVLRYAVIVSQLAAPQRTTHISTSQRTCSCSVHIRRSNGNKNLLVMHVCSNNDPESCSPDVESKVSSVSVCYVELNWEVVTKHLVTDVDDDRVHSFNNIIALTWMTDTITTWQLTCCIATWGCP